MTFTQAQSLLSKPYIFCLWATRCYSVSILEQALRALWQIKDCRHFVLSYISFWCIVIWQNQALFTVNLSSVTSQWSICFKLALQLYKISTQELHPSGKSCKVGAWESYSLILTCAKWRFSYFAWTTIWKPFEMNPSTVGTTLICLLVNVICCLLKKIAY